MQDLLIRKIPGIGRVSERLLDSIGVKVRCGLRLSCRTFILHVRRIFRHVETSTNVEAYYHYWINNSACAQCFEYTWVSHLMLSSRGRGKRGRASDQRGLSHTCMMASSNAQIEHSGPLRRKKRSCRSSRISRPSSKTTWKGEGGPAGLSR